MHGIALAAIGDRDGDTVPDLCVGDPAFTGELSRQGRIVFYSGSTGRCLGEMRGTRAGQGFGRTVVTLGNAGSDAAQGEILVGGASEEWGSLWRLEAVDLKTLARREIAHASQEGASKPLILATPVHGDASAGYLVVERAPLELGGDPQIRLFASAGGAPVWSRPTAALCTEHFMSLAVVPAKNSKDDRLLIGCGESQSVYSLSAVDGSTMEVFQFKASDKSALASVVWLSDARHGSGVIVGGFPDHEVDASRCDVLGLSARTGERLFSLRDVCAGGKGTRLCEEALEVLDSSEGQCGEVLTACSDIDGDGVDDICLGASELAAVICISGRSGLPLWVFHDQLQTRRGGALTAVGDCDGDGVRDVAVSGAVEDGLIERQDVLVLSGKSGLIVLRIPVAGGG
jgi:outer membrane protein assembly factor BamB